MDDNLTQNPHLPIYNIKAVSRLVGMLPVTLRAWERRYGLPTPSRGDQGYRLYSEYDLGTLRWLKNQLNLGMSISRAVSALHELRSSGRDPAIVAATVTSAPPTAIPLLAKQLQEAVLAFNDGSASEILRRALTLYPIDQVLSEIITPVMIEIGEMWHQGKIAIAVEHYATQFVMQHLLTMLSTISAPTRPGVIVAACAPGETHQIGILMLVVLLRWNGWEVKFLGPDLKLDRLQEALTPICPVLLLFSATRVENGKALLELTTELEKFPRPHPLVVFGGSAFNQLRLPESLPALTVNAPLQKTVKFIEALLLNDTLIAI